MLFGREKSVIPEEMSKKGSWYIPEPSMTFFSEMPNIYIYKLFHKFFKNVHILEY